MCLQQSRTEQQLSALRQRSSIAPRAAGQEHPAAVALTLPASALPPHCCRTLLHTLLATTCAQVGLGIATLLTYVPVSLGTAHQAGALTLFTLMLGLLYSIKPAPTLRPFRLLVHKYGTPTAMAAVLGVGGTVAQMH